MRNIFLWILTLVPISSVSFAAKVKINELNNIRRLDILKNTDVQIARALLWSRGHSFLSFEEMYHNFHERSGIKNMDDLDIAFDHHLQTLLDGGHIQLSRAGGSMAPSEF